MAANAPSARPPSAWITGELPARDPRPNRPLGTGATSSARSAGVGAARARSSIERAIEDASDDEGAFAPPLAVVAGELTFCFDEREALKATVTSVAPLASGDKKLRELVAEATEALKGEWPLPDDVADGFTRRLEQAFAQSGARRCRQPTSRAPLTSCCWRADSTARRCVLRAPGSAPSSPAPAIDGASSPSRRTSRWPSAMRLLPLQPVQDRHDRRAPHPGRPARDPPRGAAGAGHRARRSKERRSA